MMVETSAIQKMLDCIVEGEEWLMERILFYAKEHDYAKYTSTLVEPWRLSIAGLTDALAQAVNMGRTDLELGPDEDMTQDSIAAFAILEAQLHRKRGVSFAMFLGLMKYYRQSYHDYIDLHEEELQQLAACRNYLHRFFDRLEIAFSVEWAGIAEENTIVELQGENRRMTNEKNFFLTALESHPDAVIVVDEQGRIREMNTQAFALIGIHEHTGISYYQKTASENPTPLEDEARDVTMVQEMPLQAVVPWLAEPLQTVMQTTSPLSLTQQLYSNAENQYVRVVLTPLLDISDKFEGVVVAMADISAMVASYHALQYEQTTRRRVEQRLDATLRAADQVGLMETVNDDNHTISYFSPGAERISGYSAAELLGQSPFSLLQNPTDEEGLRMVLDQIVTKGRPISTEATIVKKDGGTITVLLNVQASYSQANDDVAGFLSVITDITERKIIERRLLQSEKMRTIAGLAAGVAHEINTPLSAILQSMQVIEQGLTEQSEINSKVADECGLSLENLSTYIEQRELPFFIKGIRDSATKASHIVSNLLQFSRPGSNIRVHTDLNKLVEQSLDLLTSDYYVKKEYGGAELPVRKEFETLPQILCIPQEIEQALMNIFKNALQALAALPEEDRRITVRSRAGKDVAQLEITDNGPGMDADTILHAFDPFFTTREVGDGEGLGLSVSHSIICDLHDGTLSLDSTPGKGSCVKIELPIAQ